MKVYQLTPGQGIDGLVMIDRPDPEPGYGQVLVRMRATSLNYRDLLLTRWNRTPVVPLSDGAGDVVAVGDGVSGLAPGDRVVGCFFAGWNDGAPTPEKTRDAFGGAIDGMLAEQAVLPTQALIRIPDYMTYDEAASLPCAAVTAWNATFPVARLHPGQSSLLLGTGGVSIFGLQFAKLAGARGIITSSSDAKLERARALGADVLINYNERQDWEKAVVEATGGRGADLVLEVAGSKTFAKSLAATQFSGHVVHIGALATEGQDPGSAPLVTKNITATRIYVGSRAMFEDMLRAMELHELHPVIDRTFAFDEAREAYRMMESQQHFGKIVITC